MQRRRDPVQPRRGRVCLGSPGTTVVDVEAGALLPERTVATRGDREPPKD